MPLLGSVRVNGVKPVPNYGTINRTLFLTDEEQRRKALRLLLDEFSTKEFIEKPALTDYLRIALAHTEFRLGHIDTAIALLKTIPLDSTKAPEALALLATFVQQQHGSAAATPWMLHAAELFPYSPASVEGLINAAQWQLQPRAALPLLMHARQLADNQLVAVMALQKHSLTAGFLDTFSLATPDPLVLSLLQNALIDPAFSHAREQQEQARAFSLCLQAHLEKYRIAHEKNPTLPQDLGVTLDQLHTLLPLAKVNLVESEEVFLRTARSAKACLKENPECADLVAARDHQGRDLTRLRNSLKTMEQQKIFLESEQKRLLLRWQEGQRQITHIGRQLMQQSAASRAIMTELLQSALEQSGKQWQALSARAHFELARTQETLLQPPDHTSRM
jgi:hypothetical protein